MQTFELIKIFKKLWNSKNLLVKKCQCFWKICIIFETFVKFLKHLSNFQKFVKLPKNLPNFWNIWKISKYLSNLEKFIKFWKICQIYETWNIEFEQIKNLSQFKCNTDKAICIIL